MTDRLMKALRIEAVGKSVLCDIPAQTPGPGEVRVKVHYVGLCGSDLNTFRGKNPLVAFPRVPGHEVAGTIVEIGAGAPEGLELGQSVILWPYSACGECTSCKAGRSYACRFNQTMGVQRDGALREEIVVPADSVIPNTSLPPRRLALVEPLSVGFHAARRGSAGAGDTVLVLGCGMIGIGAIMAAARAGAKVIAVDPIAAKEQVARASGAAQFLTLTGPELAQEIERLTQGAGVDLAIEAVGIPETFVAAVDLAAYCGRVVYVGYSKAPVTYETKQFNLKELDIFGSRNASRADFDDVVAALEELGSDADLLITREIALADASGALPYWDQHPQEVLKLVVAL
ncbi:MULTISPECIES: zinc-binding alcohol dehydrogenase family protein [unclassified Ruegeria]|uniref:zinc-binding alcohol dehydrogenase family protein n=1 Tax=unclassified Ruegeria TaxID=2625375 RepID=UPI0020C2EB85|nr:MULTISPECIES: zinc-binding alcohol dehydrogenase family protein [unclassified Ruegeria]